MQPSHSSSPSTPTGSGEAGSSTAGIEPSPDRESSDSGSQHRPRGPAWRNGVNWTRILHVYTSMLALLVVLFFGATGVTLNHPEWTFGFDSETASYDGTLPSGRLDDDGTVRFLAVSEFLRSSHGIDGDVVDFGTDLGEAFISYAEPGYTADVFFDLETGEYRLTVEQQGWVGVFNELHKGRDTGSSWSWLIDASGVFLVLIAVTGLTLQLLLSKRRRAALIWALGGSVVTIAFIVVAVA